MRSLHVLVRALDAFDFKMFCVLLLIVLLNLASEGFIFEIKPTGRPLIQAYSFDCLTVPINLCPHLLQWSGAKDMGSLHSRVLHLAKHQCGKVLAHLRVHFFGVHGQQIVIDTELLSELPTVFAYCSERLGRDVKAEVGLENV